MSVGSRLREMRLARGLVQTDLARGLTMSQSLVSQYENSERQIDADELPRIAQFLGCHPCDFYDDGADDSPHSTRADRMAANWARRLASLPERDVEMLADFLIYRQQQDSP